MTKSVTKTADEKIEDRAYPSLKMCEDESGVMKVELVGSFERICHNKTGKAVVSGLISEIVNLGSYGKLHDEAASNFAVGFLDTMVPRDAAEALLFTQMVAVHQATMTMARRLNHVKNIPQQDAAERALNKLARTYAAQMDALKRHRSKGQQTVRVERVTVENGGQAIVGTVGQGGAANET